MPRAQGAYCGACTFQLKACSDILALRNRNAFKLNQVTEDLYTGMDTQEKLNKQTEGFFKETVTGVFHRPNGSSGLCVLF